MSDPGCTLTALITQIVDRRIKELGLNSSAENARALRIRKGISVTELADRAGVSSGYISLLERGMVKNIGARNMSGITRMAEILGVSAEEYRAALLRK